MAKIDCSVDSCNYWGKGNICSADAIMVKQNSAGQSNNYNVEIGSMGAMNSLTSTETQCETFKPKSQQSRAGSQSDQYNTEIGSMRETGSGGSQYGKDKSKCQQNQAGQSNQYDTDYGTTGTAESQNQTKTPGKTSKSKSPS